MMILYEILLTPGGCFYHGPGNSCRVDGKNDQRLKKYGRRR